MSTTGEKKLYEEMITARVGRYGCTRAEAERAGAAFWSDDSHDALEASDAGCRSLEDFILYFKGKGAPEKA